MRKAIVSSVVLLSLVSILNAASRIRQWHAVDEALEKGRPQTAIGQLEKIIPGALADRAYAEAIKAVCQKIALEGDIQGGKAEEKIIRLEGEIAKAPEAMRPVMQTILAHWYRQYFQQNRWRYMQRSMTEEAPGDDITTWDLPRILAEIDKHFTAALAWGDPIKTVPISEYDDLLEKGSAPDAYRPTLYDFLVYEALSFYTAGEQAGAKPMDLFQPAADSPILGSLEEFLDWQPQTTDTSSATLKAIKLYQDLLRFHQNDDDPSALIDADLHRLTYAHRAAIGSDKDDHYKAALNRFVERWADHPISARALHHWAQLEYRGGDYVKAHQLAQRACDTHPGSVGGAQCQNLINRIEAKEARVQTERVWNDPWPDIEVRYRNITQVYFRAVACDFNDYMHPERWIVQVLDKHQVDSLLQRDAALTWSHELPNTDDYRRRVEKLPVPQGLQPGFYFLLASHRPSFDTEDNQISATSFWVSDLALVVQQRYRKTAIEGLVLDAKSGDPVVGASVTQYKSEALRSWSPGKVILTDDQGRFQFEPKEERESFLIRVRHKGHELVGGNVYMTGRPGDSENRGELTVFFTDRSLYRPGQTIHYKGLCLQVDQGRDRYETLRDKTLTVVFQDANYQEIARHRHTTNPFGSFSGSFTAPRDRLLGRMTIQVEDGPRGQTDFQVEEYKRPKFQVLLEPPAESPKLNTEVTVSGRATAYTGAAIGAAQVRWRVERRAMFPDWGWWMPPDRGASQTIAHGRAVTAADGSFVIPFLAQPDLTIPERGEPVFTFLIHTDVTDASGETRSQDYDLRLGYKALVATIELDNWQTTAQPLAITVKTQSIQEKPVSADGKLQVYRLREPKRIHRGPLSRSELYGSFNENGADPFVGDADPKSWKLAEKIVEQSFETNLLGIQQLPISLPAGAYRAVVQTRDEFGQDVSAQKTLMVLDTQARHFDTPVAFHLSAPQWSVEPGEVFTAVWGTGYERGRAFMEIECRGKKLRSWWSSPDRTQESIEQTVNDSMRGGFTLRVTYVRENRAYIQQRTVDVPWTNKQLSIKWERFRSKLLPGRQESWTALIEGPDASRQAAEMVAGLYDLSLDQYYPHTWQSLKRIFRKEHVTVRSRFENGMQTLRRVRGGWRVPRSLPDLSYPRFPRSILASLYRRGRGGGRMERALSTAAPMPEEPMAMQAGVGRDNVSSGLMAAGGMGGGMVFDDSLMPMSPSTIDLSKVSARQNLQETAFFFPHLVSDANGVVRMEFTMPEALTEWKFQGFAHDNDLRGGLLTDTVVTAKDLMVQPNAPRFVREGDVIDFTVKVSNQSAARLAGKVRLSLTDARTGESRDDWLRAGNQDKSFDIPSKESRTYSWRIAVPDGGDFLVYKAVAATNRLSDGEEGYLPVLSRRILVTESQPLPIRDTQTKTFSFDKLLASVSSDTLKHQSLTVQMTSQPAWYAVMALPYLMEFPHECSEQVFHRLYANSLAQYIAAGDPKIRRIFDQWRATPALDSPLEKNQDLKSFLIEETPWQRQAQAESQARRNVGILFDENRLRDETSRSLFQLKEMQLEDGLWPWFLGGRGNPYITLTIVTGFGRLRHLGLRDLDVNAAVKALQSLDRWMDKRYRNILKQKRKKDNHLSSIMALYLYGRSFFLEDQPVDSEYEEALRYWLDQASKHWLSLGRLSQGHMALGLKRFGDKRTPTEITTSIREYAVTNEELGMFWRDTEAGWWWYRAPIETQAVMVEAFDEVAGDAEAVEACKVWLLKQKQTQDWKTTKATADAVYALLLRGRNLLASDALVEVTLGDTLIQPEKVEAGTGFYEKRFVRNEILPAMGNITVKKIDEGVSWGAVHWQYLEDIAKITAHEGTPLKLKKALYIKENTDHGPALKAIDGPLSVGDELVTRIELRVDRDMEYVHLKDQRGSGTEPVNVLSRYRYQDGLAYYESTRDTASHFFIDYLPKGTYVFEYSTRVQHKGQYQSGIATIQCMYAPEFNSHSESVELEVR